MLATTLDVFKAALRSDPTVSPSERTQLLTLMRRGPDAPKCDPTQVSGPQVLTPRATADMLSRSPRYVHRLAAEGVLKRVRLPNRKRGIGFLQSEVERLLCQSLTEKKST